MSANLFAIKSGPFTGQLIEKQPIEYPYELDHFQKHALESLFQGHNIMITAHTGSGKTAVAELAIQRALNMGKKAIYASPIKTLSNEKYKDFQKLFPSVGLLTGDNKLNPDADVIIMTTEILCNALYRIEKNGYSENLSDMEKLIMNLGVVVFDEVHYISTSRGPVWEQSLVKLSKFVQLVLLSATVDNPEKMTKWLATIKQVPIDLIPTDKRVVPLNIYIYTGHGSDKLHHIMDNNKDFFVDNYRMALAEYTENKKSREKKHKIGPDYNIIQHTVKYCKKMDLLQVIFFAFSRKNCELYADQVTEKLVTPYEESEIGAIFSSYMHTYEKTYSALGQYIKVKELMLRGVAFHHSGLLPILKEIIEIIFHKGLIKVLFATETFAVGVNMPTRTVVFTELEKYDDTGMQRHLLPAEFWQMSGRAGRRGKDLVGNVILLPLHKFTDDLTYKSIAFGKVQPIESKLKIDYKFYLRSIQSQSTNIEDFMVNSLYAVDSQSTISTIQSNIDKLAGELTDFKLDQDTETKFEQYYNLDNNSGHDLGIKIGLSKPQQKLLQKLKSEINANPDMSKLYCQYKENRLVQTNIQKLNREMDNQLSYVRTSCELIKQFLVVSEYLTNDYGLTTRAIVSSQINECNELLLTEMIIQRFFDGLTPAEIVGLLAVFIQDENKTEPYEFTNLTKTKVSAEILDRIEWLHQIRYEFRDMEKQVGIRSQETDEYWDFSYSFVNPAFMWASEESIRNVFDQMNNCYEGNFVRNMLKINKIVEDVIELCKVTGYVEILPVLEKIPPLIIREIVTVNSLYLSS